MKITCDPRKVRAAAQCVSYFFSSSGGSEYDLAILKLTEAGVTLTVDSGSCYVSTLISPYKVEGEGEVVVPISSKIFLDISRALRGHEVVFEHDSETGLLTVETDRAKWTLPFGLFSFSDTTDDFKKGFDLNIAELEDCLKTLRPYVGTDTGRPSLMAVHFDGKKGRACDGGRYKEYRIQADQPFYIPATYIDSFARLLKRMDSLVDTVRTEVGENWVRFTVGPLKIQLAQPSFPFPDLETVLVKPMKSQVPSLLKVFRNDFLAALNEVKVFADPKLPQVHITLQPEKMTVMTERVGGSSAKSEIQIGWAGATREALFDLSHLRELIAGCEEELLEIRLGKDRASFKSPFIVEDSVSWAMLNQMNKL